MGFIEDETTIDNYGSEDNSDDTPRARINHNLDTHKKSKRQQTFEMATHLNTTVNGTDLNMTDASLNDEDMLSEHQDRQPITHLFSMPHQDMKDEDMISEYDARQSIQERTFKISSQKTSTCRANNSYPEQTHIDQEGTSKFSLVVQAMISILDAIIRLIMIFVEFTVSLI